MPERNDPDAATVETLRRIVMNAKGNDLERLDTYVRMKEDDPCKANHLGVDYFIFHHPREKLVADRTRWIAARDLLERMIARRDSCPCCCCELQAELARLRAENARLLANLTLERAARVELEKERERGEWEYRVREHRHDDDVFYWGATSLEHARERAVQIRRHHGVVGVAVQERLAYGAWRNVDAGMGTAGMGTAETGEGRQ